MAFDAGRAVAYLTMDTSQYSEGISTATRLLGQLTDSSLSASTRLQSLGDAAKQLGTTLTTAVTAPTVAVGAMAVKTFTGFDDAIKQVQATMAAGEEDVAKLTATAKQMGATTRYSASEAAEALNYLALAGYNADQACQSLPQVLALAQAGGMDLAYASDLATDAMSALGLGIGDLSRFTDQMARTAQKSNTSVSQLGEAILTVGGTARQLAGGTVELNTQLGILADNGIKGAEGGTALRNIILSLTAPTDQAARLMQAYGLSCYDANGNLRGTEEIFRDLNAVLGTMTQQQRSEVLSQLFNKVDLKAAEALLANCTDRYDELSQAVTDSQGATQAMADTMESGIGGSFRNLSSAVEAAAISFGEALAPTVQKVAEKVTELATAFAGLPESTQQTIAKVALVAAAVGPLLLAGGKLISLVTALSAAMSGPAGWITLGVAGIAALTMGAIALGRALHQVDPQDKWKEMMQNADSDVTASMSATINAEIDANVDAGPAKSAIQTAIDELESALASFGLSEDQIAQIQSMIGQDYDAIYARCLEFGLSEAQAGQLAAQVDGLNQMISARLQGLSVALDAPTLMKLLGEAAGNKQIFINACRQMGLTDEDVEQVAAVFDDVNGRIADRIPSLLDTIREKLTDGQADTPEMVAGLKADVQNAFDTALADVDLWESLQLSKLDPDAPDFDAACERIRTQAAETRTELESLRTETETFVDSMAGQSTATVTEHLNELDAVEARVDAVLDKIGLAQSSARDVGRTQYDLTAAGATMDADTVAQGVQWAYQNYKLDVQAIEDAAKQARADADQAWQDGLMTDAEHLDAEQRIDAQLESDNAAVLEVYRSRMSELLAGIYDAYASVRPEEAANLEGLLNAPAQIDAILDELASAGASSEAQAKARDALQSLADSLVPDEGFAFLEGGPLAVYGEELKSAIEEQTTQAMEDLSGENNPLTTLLSGIAESGATAPLELDLSDWETVVTACMGDVGAAGAEAYSSALSSGANTAQSSGAAMGSSGAAGAGTARSSFTQKGRDAAQGYANGIRAKIRTVREAAAALAREGASALAQAQDSHSPAKLHMGLGRNAGDGYALGIRDRIPEARSAAADLVRLSMVQPQSIPAPAAARPAGAAEGAWSAQGLSAGGGATVNLHIDTVHVGDESDVRRYANLLGTYLNDRNYR